MARQREYEIETVVRGAMRVFWQKGYVAASMSDIYEVTGLKPGNLYATFKDKEHLFGQAFEAYAADFRASLPDGIEGIAAIEIWLEKQVQLGVGDKERKGCLIINTVIEREAHSQQNRARAQARMDEIKSFFERNLAIAVDDGEIQALDIDAAADALTGAVVAIMALARGGASDQSIRNVARQAARLPGQKRGQKRVAAHD